MSSRSEVPTAVQASSASRRGSRFVRAAVDRGSSDHVVRLPRAALAYAARCHLGQRRGSDGAPFIEHLSEVARLLRDCGCSDAVVAAGLLHAVVQDTDVDAAELTARFGAPVCDLVLAMTDRGVASYPRRKDAFREQIREAGDAAALLFAADEIAEVRELADEVRRERARFAAAQLPDEARDRVQRYRQMCLEHHRASLAMLDDLAPDHRLVRQLADELDRIPINLRGVNRVGAPR